MKIELTFTDDEIAAIEMAREAANIAAGSIVHADVAAYVQFVMQGAAAGYARQWSPVTVEGLAARVALLDDAKARAESEAMAQRERADAMKAQHDALAESLKPADNASLAERITAL